MTVRIVAPVGGPTENPPDIGDRETTMLDGLVTGLTLPVDATGSILGAPPAFPWGGHSNGVSSNR